MACKFRLNYEEALYLQIESFGTKLPTTTKKSFKMQSSHKAIILLYSSTLGYGIFTAYWSIS